jgi:hypothetical protein
VFSRRPIRKALGFPVRQIGQRAGIPPQRNAPRSMSLRDFSSQSEMWPWQIDDHIIELKAGDFRDPQAAAAGQTYHDSVAPIVG